MLHVKKLRESAVDWPKTTYCIEEKEISGLFYRRLDGGSGRGKAADAFMICSEDFVWAGFNGTVLDDANVLDISFSR